MRDAFVKALMPIAAADPSVVLMTGDLGFGVLDGFRQRYPKQFYNVGVAEQNLAGVAAGLAMAGCKVLTYSIANFPILRCLEQVRNDICYHQADVKIVSIGGGMAYGALGYSHFATEDLAILRSLPGLTVVAPGDPVEVEQLLPQIMNLDGPVYLRLGRAGERPIHDSSTTVVLGQPTVARDGSHVLILTTGGMLPVAMQAADQLSLKGIEIAVVSIHTLSPLDAAAMAELMSSFDVVITVEEHSTVGGIGSASAEVIAEAGISVRFCRLGLQPTAFPSGVGSQEHLRRRNCIDAESVVSTVGRMLD